MARRIYARKREGLCIPTRRCIRQTPYGEVEGMECPAGDEVYHNTTIEVAKKIAEAGEIRIQRKDALGQDAISFSSCPGQAFGGNIKLVVKTQGTDLRPMCYYDHEKHREVEKGLDKESQERINGSAGLNRVRAKYAVDAAILHSHECENISYTSIPAKQIKRLEYWIPWNVGEAYPTTGCSGALPSYSFSEYGNPVAKVQEKIAESKKVADSLGAKFEAKSCFTALKTGWGDQYIPLNDRTLNMLAKGRVPKVIQGKVPQLCRC